VVRDAPLIGLSIVFALLPLGILALIVFGAWKAVASARGGGAITFGGVLAGYFYLVEGASLIVVLVGVTMVLTAGFGAWFGQEFSYRPPFIPPTPAPAVAKPAASAKPEASATVVSPGPTPTPTLTPEQHDRQQRDLNQQQRTGLTQGISLAIVAAILAGLHYIGRRLLLPLIGRDPAPSRVFLGIMLAAFSITGVVALPVAAAQTAGYLTADPEAFSSTGQRPDPPGGALALAIAVLPFWGVFLWNMVREARRARHPELQM